MKTVLVVGDLVVNKRRARTPEESRKYYLRSRNKITMRNRARSKKYISEWINHFSDGFVCSVCGKSLEFAPNDKNFSVHFDHRNDKSVAVKGSPKNFFYKRGASKENIDKWNSYDFGALCHVCNSRLPTKGRIEFLKKALRYALESQETDL
jgi:hypothetical protein